METIIERRTAYQGKKISVLELDVRLDTGKVVTWEAAHKGGDSVAILPIEADGSLVLVEEYFAAIDERSLCLPKGTLEPGEDEEVAARREMIEEVHRDGTLERLLHMSVSPGYLTQRTTVFLATDLRAVDGAGDEEHHLKAVVLSLADALAGIRGGRITEARTVAAVATYALSQAQL
jgi:8-oxo-dGTP pyrophosphatase MutT (NUDIX family)